jgi:hypothetical protein
MNAAMMVSASAFRRLLFQRAVCQKYGSVSSTLAAVIYNTLHRTTVNFDPIAGHGNVAIEQI